MRVLFLTLYPEVAASPRYRVTQFLPYLRAHGIECTVASPLTSRAFGRLTGPGRFVRPFWYHVRESLRRLPQVLGAVRFDVVFVQKAIMTAYVCGAAELLRVLARRVVYDFDDAVHLAPPHPLSFPWRVLEDRDQIGRLMRMADLVLAGNRWLADAARTECGRVEWFPTVVDTDRFVPATPDLEHIRRVQTQGVAWIRGEAPASRDEVAGEANVGGQTFEYNREPSPLIHGARRESGWKPLQRERKGGADVFRIGWMGNPSTMACLEPAAAALAQVRDAGVCLVGADPRRIAGFGAEMRPWSIDTEVTELHRFTVGIMPQPEAEWMRGKCGLKALLYMACGVPCVASPFGAALEFLRDGENGLFARTTDEWLAAFERLREPALRARIAAAGRRTVEEEYSLRRAAPRLLELLRSVS